MADTNRSRLSVVPEIALGVPSSIVYPGSAGSNLLRVRKTSEGINFPKSTKVSDEIRDDRNITNLIDMGGQVGGNVAFEMYGPSAYSDQNLFLQSLYSATFVDQRFNVVQDMVGGLATFTATTMTLAAGTFSGAPAIGDIVNIRGSGIGNDGPFQITAIAGTAYTIVGVSPYAGTITPGVSAPGTSITFVGRNFATGVTSISSGGVISFSLAHNLPVVVGQWVKLSNTGVAATNVFARVKAVSSNSITLDNLPTGFTAISSAIANMIIFTSSYLRNGTQENSFQIEQAIVDVAAPYSSVSSGVLIDQGSFSFDTGAVVTGSYTVMGVAHAAGTTASLGSPAPALTTRAMSARTNVARMCFNGSALGGLASAKSLSLAIANNLRAKPGIGSAGLIGIGQGQFALTGQMSSYFSDGTSYDLYLAAGQASVSVCYGIDNQFIVQSVPRLQMTSNQHTAGGSNQDIMAAIAFQGLIDPVTNCATQLDYFEFAA